MDEKVADRAFARARRIFFLRERQEQIANADYWRALNPALTITSSPLAELIPDPEFGAGMVDRCLDSLVREGYFQTPPAVPANLLANLSAGIDRVVRAGFPPFFACVYDEFYQAFAGLSPILGGLLGADYLMVPEGLSTFHVGTGGDMAGSGPHRDSLGPDASVTRGEAPALINIWIALTDATPLNSCMYVLPAPHDPQYHQGWGRDIGDIDLQAIRALPVAAGSVLGWSTHLLHWGGRSSDQATQPRMSVALYFQRGDVAPFDKTAIPPTAEFQLHDRLAWISASYSDPEVFRFPAADTSPIDS